MNDPIRRPLPEGVSYVVTEHNQSAPTLIVITIQRENYQRIGFCIAAVIDQLVMTTTRRVLDLIRSNPGIMREVAEFTRHAGDEVQIPLRLHRHVDRGNRVFAITVASQHIAFNDALDTSEPGGEPGNLPAQAMPELTEGDRGAAQMVQTMVTEGIFLIDPSGLLSAAVSAVQMCATILEFRDRHIPYAYRRGFWHVVFWEEPQDRDGNQASAFGSSSGAQRERVIQAYRNGYADGTNVRDSFHNGIWRRIYASRTQWDQATRTAVERMIGRRYRHARRLAITIALRRRYPWYSEELQRLIRYPWQ